MKETIGSVSTGNMPDDEGWILFALDLAKEYVELVCGNPPDESRLEVIWHDHEMGCYPSLGVSADCGTGQIEDYIRRCESALTCFDSSVDWLKLQENYHSSIFPDERD